MKNLNKIIFQDNEKSLKNGYKATKSMKWMVSIDILENLSYSDFRGSLLCVSKNEYHLIQFCSKNEPGNERNTIC